MPRVAASRSRCASSSRRSRSSTRSTRAIGVAGIGCYTSFSGTMDVDLVQALHGRAPSVATGVKRMLPDALVFTLQGDGDMVNEGLQEVHPHRGARREDHVHPAEQRRVRRDRRPHDRDDRDRPAHEELARRPRRRVPRLPDPDRRPDRAAPGRGVRRARLGAQRGRGRPHAEDVQAGVRVAARGRGLLVRPNGWTTNFRIAATKRFGRLARISANRFSMVLKPARHAPFERGKIFLLPALVLPAFERGRQQIELGQDVAKTCRQHLLALERAAERQQRHVGAERKRRRIARELAIESRRVARIRCRREDAEASSSGRTRGTASRSCGRHVSRTPCRRR